MPNSILQDNVLFCLANWFGQTCFCIGSRHPAAAFFLQVLKLCTQLDPNILCILILKGYGKFARKNKMRASARFFLPAAKL